MGGGGGKFLAKRVTYTSEAKRVTSEASINQRPPRIEFRTPESESKAVVTSYGHERS